MTGKIFKGMISVAVTVMLLCAIFLIGILCNYFNSLVFAEIQNEAYFIASGITSAGDAYLDDIAESENRITIIEPDGTVYYDSEGDAETMENHGSREEVLEALESGEGQSTRQSDTIGTETLYYASRMEDGRILRVAAKVDSVWVLVLGVVHPMVVVLICTAILAAVLSSRISKRILRPVNEIDPGSAELREPYEELAPLIQKIRTQNAHIQKQMQELKRRQTEFRIITENMSEGFLILDRKTEILSYNSAALRLLDVTEEDARKSRSVLAVNRSESFRTAVELALDGKHNQQPMASGEMCYHIVANPVLHSGLVTGVIIIILDVTEKEKREQLRREFTSNVSHELKTPLTTIYGIADMICGGMVKPEDLSGFSETIRSESQRMIALIDDIIKISRLDEGTEKMEQCETDLFALAHNVAQRLSYAAQKAGVTISVTGESAVINGVPAVLEEMLYNLTDNAIKYNHENGRVTLTAGQENGRCFVTVEDTGIGIPLDAQERVFERFYRVDKSHSRKIGGTGLGLSIVKHGAALHGAVLSLESTVGSGTKIKVVF